MSKGFKILAIVAGGVAGLCLCIVLYVLIASESVLARVYPVPLTAFDAPSDSASVRRGEHLATIYGCNNCHGPELQGTVFYDAPRIARIHAPNLTNVAKDYTDTELARLLRYGVKRDGTSVWIMPSQMYSHLTDEDLGAIIAYVRSMPERPGIERDLTLRVLGRIGILNGQFRPVAAQVPAKPAQAAAEPADALARGRYLVMTACTECHGTDLNGSEFLKAPSLMIAGAYSDREFAHLMRTGAGLGGRRLGLMERVSQARFAAFTDEELIAVRAYLEAFVRNGGTDPLARSPHRQRE